MRVSKLLLLVPCVTSSGIVDILNGITLWGEKNKRFIDIPRIIYSDLVLRLLSKPSFFSKTGIGFENPSSQRVKKEIENNLRSKLPPTASLEQLQMYGLILASNTCTDIPRLKEWKCPVHCEGLTSGIINHYIYAEDTGEFKFSILSHPKEKSIFVAIRGSGRVNKIAQAFQGIHPHDIKQKNLPWHSLRDDIKVHIPFYESSKIISEKSFPEIKALLEKPEFKDYKLVILGHSLGGAVAPLVAMDLKDMLNLPKSRTELHTFDTPRVGNIVFANIVSYHFSKLTRVTHGYDPLPHNLFRLAHYVHFANELYYPPMEYFNSSYTDFSLPQKRLPYKVPNNISKSFLNSISDEQDSKLDLSQPRRGKENKQLSSIPVFCVSNPPYDLEDRRCSAGITDNFNYTSHIYAPSVTYVDTCGKPDTFVEPFLLGVIAEIAKFDSPFIFKDELKPELLNTIE